MVRNGIQIGLASAQTGLSIDAIRFYEKQRLLERQSRTEGGFRLFTSADIERIRFIKSAQHLGFSLTEIRELLLLQHEQDQACSHVRDLLKEKLAATRQKLQALHILEKQLAKSLRKCERRLKHSAESHQGDCPVLKEIAHRGSDEN